MINSFRDYLRVFWIRIRTGRKVIYENAGGFMFDDGSILFSVRHFKYMNIEEMDSHYQDLLTHLPNTPTNLLPESNELVDDV